MKRTKYKMKLFFLVEYLFRYRLSHNIYIYIYDIVKPFKRNIFASEYINIINIILNGWKTKPIFSYVL